MDEDEHQIIVNGSKLLECHIICMALTEQRAKIPLDIQAQANYYMSIGKSSLQSLFSLILTIILRT